MMGTCWTILTSGSLGGSGSLTSGSLILGGSTLTTGGGGILGTILGLTGSGSIFLIGAREIDSILFFFCICLAAAPMMMTMTAIMMLRVMEVKSDALLWLPSLRT